MKEVNIVLNQEDLDVLSKALVELPFRLAAPLIGKIERQLAEQSCKEEKCKTED